MGEFKTTKHFPISFEKSYEYPNTSLAVAFGVQLLILGITVLTVILL